MGKKIINTVFIGDDIETRIVFKNALEQLENEVSIQFFFETDAACKSILAEHKRHPEFLFLNAREDLEHSLKEIEVVRQHFFKRETIIVIYDPHSVLPDASKILSLGVDAFVSKPYDFSRLRKALRRIIFPKIVFDTNYYLSSSQFDF